MGIVQSASFGAARALLWYVARAALDLELHARFDENSETLAQVEKRIFEQYTGMPHCDDECWVCIFDHVFDGDTYAANEYSYLWGQVIAFDAFEAFQEEAAQDTAAVSRLGARFRNTVLGVDVETPFLEVYRRFRGRDASTAALLRHKARQTVPPRSSCALPAK